MNAPTSTLEPEVEVTSGELVLLNEQTTLQVLTDEKRFEDLLAKIKAEAAAKAKREADAKHRATVMGAAKEALMKHAGIDEEAARQAVLAIRAGEVPHVSITF